MLLTLLALVAFSLLFSLSLTPVVRILALRWNLVDRPDNKRKVHRKPIPRVGGIAMISAYFGSFLVVASILTHMDPAGNWKFDAIRSIAPATLLIFAIGLADDIFNLRPWQKFAVQVLAGVLVVSAGVELREISGLTGSSLLGKIATVVWLVACTNAVNLIDGLDGLAAGIALLATMTTLVASLVNGQVELTVATAPLAGALIGFLFFNFNPASIFLGDCGSLVLGFLLGCYSVLWSTKSATMLGMMAPLMALSVPLMDTSLAIARRFLRNQPIFSPDRSHIHHRLLARGLTHKRAVLLLYIAGGTAGAFSLTLIWVHSHLEAVVLVAFIGAAILGVQQLGYVEFEAARKVLLRLGLRREINAELAVQNFEQNLLEAATPDDCREVIQQASEEFGFQLTRMRLASQTFLGRTPAPACASSINIAISEDDWIQLSFDGNRAPSSNALLSFVTVTRRILASKTLMLDFARTGVSPTLYGGTPSTVHTSLITGQSGGVVAA